MLIPLYFLLKFFVHLCSENLLKRCLHGTIQNSNEAFNQIIWKRCPKDVFVCKEVLDIGLALAVIHFNDGVSGCSKVFEV